MKPTDETVERVARALCRLQVLRNVEIGAYKADIERGVEMCWVHFQGEARAAIAAMPEPWMTIESAPKDRFIMLYCPEDKSRWLAKWQGGRWYGVDVAHGLTREGYSAGDPDIVTGWTVMQWTDAPSPPQKDEQP